MNRNKVFAAMLALVMLICTVLPASADGLPKAEQASAQEADKPAFSFGECSAAAVCECNTGTVLAEKNGSGALPAGHLAKLMTFLLTAEAIKGGTLTEADTAVCSANANSQQDPQIWLEVGEKITVSELMKSVSIGNANDAAVCLAEKLCGSESEYTALANSRAAALGMKNTTFADVCGSDEATRSGAVDLCLLCAELARHKEFSGYFTTWLDTVREGKAELVSRNRLMRSCKGIRGFKVGSTKAAGECAAVCAERGDMTVCAVILGAKDEDDLLEQARRLLDTAFASCEVYYPEVPEEALAECPVTHGVRPAAPADIPGLRPVIIAKGTYKSIECEFEREESLEAPVAAGDVLGHITFKQEGRVLISEDICAAEQTDRVDMGFSLKRVLFNLLNL